MVKVSGGGGSVVGGGGWAGLGRVGSGERRPQAGRGEKVEKERQ